MLQDISSIREFATNSTGEGTLTYPIMNIHIIFIIIHNIFISIYHKTILSNPEN